ncbi:MAG TPA: glycosyltransferase [bacterium]|nr:glycosyltransferase [bacterium]
MAALLYITVLLTVLYSLSLLFIFAGLYRDKPRKSDQRPMVSVIIACRNEERHVTPLLQALSQQTYPQDLYEILLSDDGSTDATAERASAFSRNSGSAAVRVISVQGRDKVISAKKNALAQAIAASRGELLLFTDADCRPSPHWLQGMTSRFTPEVAMVIGYSPYELPSLNTLGSRLIALEALSLAALAAGCSGWGRPATCTGRNLGYRKSAYEQVGGFRDIAGFVSGDDDLFLKLVLKHNLRVRYALAPELAVPTYIPPSAGHLIRQRLRHASKGFHYGPVMTGVLFSAWLFNFLLLTALFTPYRRYGLILWTIKAASELPLLLAFAGKMKRLACFTVWPIAAIVHVFYVVLFGALGPFCQVSWKGGDSAP